MARRWVTGPSTAPGESSLERADLTLGPAAASYVLRYQPKTVPTVVRGESRQLFEGPVGEDDLVLLLYINFEISQKEIRGYLALVMDLPSLETLRSLVRDFLEAASS